MPKKVTKLSKRNRARISLIWKQYLESKGDRAMTLNPDKYKPGIVFMQTSKHSFRIFGLPVIKTVQRSFSVGKTTLVPTVLADQFTESGDIIEVTEND